MLRKQLEGVQCHSLLWNVAGSVQSKGRGCPDSDELSVTHNSLKMVVVFNT